MKGKTLLLVEDEAIVAMLEKRQLENYGYAVRHALSGVEAVDLICSKGEKFDLVLMDIDLGSGIDGTEAAKQILECIDIPIVFLSSHTEPAVVEKTEKITSYGYVVKQSSITVLDASIKMAFKLYDATKKERNAKRLMETRLALIEYSIDHTLKDLIGKTLDCVSEYVDSPVGFYHFIEEDQKTIRLQQWSTRTLNEFCTAGAYDAHYPIDQAGVWVDCVYQKKPVIHNDYASLGHRKGLPEGHPLLTRELVVPVIRGDKIVSIMGIGNKATDYTCGDVEVVAYLADVTWQIIDQKRIEEALKESRDELLLKSLVLDQVKDNVTITDMEGRITYVNNAVSELLNNRKEELSGSTTDVYGEDPDKGATQKEIVETTLKEGAWRGEVINYDKRGNEHIMDCRTQLVYDLSGKPVALAGIGTDVTERKLSEEALRESEEKYKTIFNNAPLGIFRSTPGGRFIEVNPALAEMLGYDSPETVLQEIQSIAEQVYVRPDERQPIVTEHFKGKNLTHHVNHYRRASGEEFIANLYLTTIRDDSGEILYLEGIVEDITDLRESKKKLQQSEELFRTLFDQAAVGVARVEPGGKLIMVNSRFCEITGYTGEELSRMNFQDITHPEDFHIDDENISRVMAGEIDSFEIEKRYIHKKGYPVWIRLYSNVIRDDAGAVKYAIASIVDISKQKEADQYIQFLSSITEQVNDSIIVSDSQFKIVYINKAAEVLFGYSRDELSGKQADILNDEPVSNELQKELYTALSKGEVYKATWLNRRKDGTTFYCDFQVSQMVDKNGSVTGYIGIQRDVTEYVEIKNALQQSEAAVRKKLKALTEPSGSYDDLDLSDIIDSESLQSLMEEFYAVTGIGSAIVDIRGNILTGVGWQDICTKFHRVNPETQQYCIESDTELVRGIAPGEFRAYKCKNTMWDIASPVVIGESHLGNVFFGQFFYEDEPVDVELFQQQARRYGFDEKEYLAALNRVPRFNREIIDNAMKFFSRLAGMISQLGYSNLQLSRALSEKINHR